MRPLLVLGAGQLGLMMAEAGARLGISVDRLDAGTSELIPGSSSFRVATGLDALLNRYAVISAEVEHLPSNALVDAIRSSASWLNRKAFDVLPDRATQKAMLDSLEVPCAPWRLIEAFTDIDEFSRTHGKPLVVKTTRHGYDGKGQWRGATAEQVAMASEHLGHAIAETHVEFSRELSIVGVRGHDGVICFYPLIENHHRDGILRFSLAPASDCSVLQDCAETLLRKIMEHLDYVGVMAVECFDTPSGLLVNEIAPRVHNSGHWTQLGTHHDQFASQVRALSNLPLFRTQRCRPTLMLNLIGCEFRPEWLSIDGMQCRWYGKDYRPGRKLGHINVDLSDERLATNVEQLDARLDGTHQGLLRVAMDRATATGLV